MNVNSTKEGREKRTIDGFVFDSELEARFYTEVIKPQLVEGKIVMCKVHPSYLLQEPFTKYGKRVNAVYAIWDFHIIYEDGTEEIIDIKGMATKDAILKRKWFDLEYPSYALKWLSFSKIDGGWIDYDLLQLNRRKRAKWKKEGHMQNGDGVIIEK